MNRLILVIISVMVVFLASVLVLNRDLYPIPNPDVFRYADDGSIYMSGSLPDNIHVPPGNPLLIGFLSTLFNFPTKEVIIGVWINIISTIGSVIIFIIILWKLKRGILLPALLIICTNPLTYLIGVSVTSEALFSFVVLASMLFVARNQLPVALWIAWISFLVRYEGAGLVISILVIMLIRNVKHSFKWIGISLALFVGWLFVLHYHNVGNSLVDNTYIQEIMADRAAVPNFKIVNDLAAILMFESRFWPNIPWLLNGLILASLFIGFFSRIQIVKAASLFSIVYVLIHLCFPNHDDRYLFPLIWIVPFLILHSITLLIRKGNNIQNDITVVFLFFLSLYFGWHNQNRFLYELNNKRVDGIETRVVADWVNNRVFEKPSIMLTLQPWILSYYAHNPNVDIVFTSVEDIALCQSLNCIINKHAYSHGNTDVYIVLDGNIMDGAHLEDYWQKRFGIRHYFNFFMNLDYFDAKIIYKWEQSSLRVVIYKLAK